MTETKAGPPDDLTLPKIGYSHIDPVWLWLRQEGLPEVKATFRPALDRMDEYPEFESSISSAASWRRAASWKGSPPLAPRADGDHGRQTASQR